MEFKERLTTVDNGETAKIETIHNEQEPIVTKSENYPESSEISSELKSFFDSRSKVIELSKKIEGILVDDKGLYEIPADLEFDESGQLKKIKINLCWGDGKLGKILHEKAKVDLEEYKKRGEDFACRLNDGFIMQAYNKPENEAESAVKDIIDEYFTVKMQRRMHYEKLNESLDNIKAYYGSFGNIYKFIYETAPSKDLDEKINNFDIGEIERYISENKGKSVYRDEDYASQMKEYADTYMDIVRLLENGLDNILKVNADKSELDESQLIAQNIIQNLTKTFASINVTTNYKELSEFKDQELKRIIFKFDEFKRMNLSGLSRRIDERI
jgi:hypothetical protein